MPRKKPCLGANRRPCPTRALTDHESSRCDQCRSAFNTARDAIRGSAADRGYDAAWRELRLTILERDKHTCHWCGLPANTVDHVTSKSAGGTDDPSNLVAACGPCNGSRSAQQRKPQF